MEFRAFEDTAEYGAGVRFFIEYGDGHPRFRAFFVEGGVSNLIEQFKIALSLLAGSPESSQYFHGLVRLSASIAQASCSSWAQDALFEYEICEVLANALRFETLVLFIVLYFEHDSRMHHSWMPPKIIYYILYALHEFLFSGAVGRQNVLGSLSSNGFPTHLKEIKDESSNVKLAWLRAKIKDYVSNILDVVESSV